MTQDSPAHNVATVATPDGLAQAQLRATLQFGWAGYVFNALLCLSVLALQPPRQRDDAALTLWFGACMAFILLRMVLHHRLLASGAPKVKATDGLTIITAGALASSLMWAALPLCFTDFDADADHSMVAFLMLAMATAARVRGAVFMPLGLAVTVPPLVSLSLALLLDPHDAGRILLCCILMLTLMLVRSCRITATAFVAETEIKLEAIRLSRSLQAANEDLLTFNRRLQLVASSDPLTGLANRGMFNTYLARAVSDASRPVPLSVLMLDLDGFKTVNDLLGHPAGDAVLEELAGRLSRIADSGVFVSRFGGDKFATILHRTTDSPWEAEALAEALLCQVRLPFVAGGRSVSVQASVGIAHYPEHGETPAELLACADRALLVAKSTGRNTILSFSLVMRERMQRQRQVEADIASALKSGAVEAWFQPQVRLTDTAVIGFESLVRWHHPGLGRIGAEEIVQAVHQTQNHELLARRMVKEACLLIQWLDAHGLTEATVAVNVSPQDFTRYDVGAMLWETVRAHRVNPARLELELTEESLLDPDLISADLKRIETLGFKLAIDDFGMGHTSLAYLTTIRIDRMKIDRHFVAAIATNRQSQALVAAMVAMGCMLGVNILVEGVENHEDLKTLRQLGCQTAQGYLFGAPMPMDRLTDWLKSKDEAGMAG